MIKPEQLTCRCGDEDVIRPQAQEDAPLLPGQEKAMAAVSFGLSLKKPYFNITVCGPSRSGKTTVVRQLAMARASQESSGWDVCITPNFSESERPGVLYLQPGSGAQLNQMVDELLQTLDEQIPKFIEQPSVKAHLQQLNEAFNEKALLLTRGVEREAEEKGLFMQTSTNGVALIPLKDGKPLKDEDFIALPAEERERIGGLRKEIIMRMAEINPLVMELEKERRDAVEQFVEQSIRQLVHGYVAGIRQRVDQQEALESYLGTLEEELVKKRFLFLSEATSSQPFGGAQLQVLRAEFARKCRVNVLVNRSGAESAPVVVEDNPTYSNLIGGVDFTEEHGVLKSDYTQIRAGSLVQASDGYLILQAQDLLQYPLAYVSMKRALRAGQLTLRDQFSEHGLRSITHMEPQPVRITAKVIVVGEERLIQMMLTLDEEFTGLFKIHADFLSTLERTEDSLAQLVAYLEYHAKQQDLLPLADSAIARVVEEASRTVSHQQRLSGQVNELVDILIEADLLAREQGLPELQRELVHAALKGRQQRHGRIEEVVKREIREGTILLDCDGAKVGQVNGLAVYQMGRTSFGIPTRITAQAYAGRRGLINIEREADLSGRIHTKGVLILNGYLGSLFARKEAMALSLSVTFEQSYGGIDGDSATCAEFFAIISAISGIPLRQALAVTGSMNQHGEVQPIGGVNEKVTGFYQFVKAHDFPEGSGVIIPAVNTVNLLLDAEIIEAVEAGRFAIHPIRRIEEGLEIILGTPAGTMDEKGEFLPESIYGKTHAQLRAFAKGGGNYEKGLNSKG